ncbi:MAG: recombinase family protein [Desulfatiglandaceae bacterium]
MQKAYAYLRVSGQGQLEGDGFERQRKAINDYAALNDIEVVTEFREEGVSGTLQDRPMLARLLVDLEENGHGIKTIIVERVDRLARDLMVQEAIINDLKKKGFDLITALEGDKLLSDDPTRKLVRQVLGAIAEYDKTMTVMKLRAARERKRQRDGKCEGAKSLREVSPELLTRIKLLRRPYKNGRRLKLHEIADRLNQEGYRTRRGKPFTGQNVANIMHRF